MYLLKSESISKFTSQDQLRGSRAACCDWQQWKESKCYREREKKKNLELYTLAPLLQNHSRWLSPSQKSYWYKWQWPFSTKTLGENCSLIKSTFPSMNWEWIVRNYMKIINMPFYVLVMTIKTTETTDINPRTSCSPTPRLSEWLTGKIWTLPTIPDYLLLEE